VKKVYLLFLASEALNKPFLPYESTSSSETVFIVPSFVLELYLGLLLSNLTLPCQSPTEFLIRNILLVLRSLPQADFNLLVVSQISTTTCIIHYPTALHPCGSSLQKQ
jgi:hypothetical protein